MQATMAIFRAGGSGRSPSSKPCDEALVVLQQVKPVVLQHLLLQSVMVADTYILR